MTEFPEKKVARQLLKCRDDDYSIVNAIRQSKVYYGLHVVVLFGLVVALVVIDDLMLKFFFTWAFGMFCGAHCRDIHWLRRMKRIWPFYLKIVNWQKVEEIAEGKDASQDAQ